MEETRKGPKRSVCRITFNNERTAERALSSVQWVDEIVVVGSFSTDQPLEICQRFTPKVFQKGIVRASDSVGK
jgi:glycosyltransferase involved in cell wall biosynthesis